jgi:hypothetical protein
MARRRSILWHGLGLVAARPGTLLWTYALNLGLALVFSLRLHAQLGSILDHSLEAERLNSAFDLGVLTETIHRLGYMAPATGASSYVGLPLYLLGYFILVPGALFCYRTDAPSRLSIMASWGIAYFWRFVRITLLTGVVSAAVLVPMSLAQAAWSAHVDETLVGEDALLHDLPGVVAILLVAALLRLYFDLVEVYTVQLGDQYRENGKEDRRVRRVLWPALKTLFRNFWRAYFSFLTLTVLGFAAFAAAGWATLHMLAEPRMWPAFLFTQAGLLAMMATRFWQRGAETILATDYPLLQLQPQPSIVESVVAAEIVVEITEPTPVHFAGDAQPDPEPAAPSLDEPDPAVFQHEPEPLPPQPPFEPAVETDTTDEPKRQVPWWME